MKAAADQFRSHKEDAPGLGIVLFDGHCALCNGTVHFIWRRDRRSHFRYASLQSQAGTRLRGRHGLVGGLDTVVLIEAGVVSTQSTAVLRIARHLGWPSKLLAGLLVIAKRAGVRKAVNPYNFRRACLACPRHRNLCFQAKKAICGRRGDCGGLSHLAKPAFSTSRTRFEALNKHLPAQPGHSHGRASDRGPDEGVFRLGAGVGQGVTRKARQHKA